MATIKPMAILPTPNRVAGWNQMMRSVDCPGGINKAQGQAVFNAIDQWADDNATSFNNAIPQPQRGILSAREKAAFLVAVMIERYNLA